MNNYFVATSIPYVNGEPHLGHAMEFIIADVLARHARIQGKNVIFSTGTDEHGEKISEKAVSLGMTPMELATENSQKFRDLCNKLNISNNRFIRTTDKEHESSAQEIWLKLKEHIYKGRYEGWYCVGDEAYFSESEVKANNGICPNHNRPYERIEEENYFFELSKYSDQIKQAIQSEDFKIYPQTRRNEVLSLLDMGLEDISISRPKSKTTWGIDVPDDQDQVMYVWFEALMNYITVLGYPDKQDFNDFWPAEVQVIGKDILRFHGAIWPAMLMALNLKLPKVLYVHGHVNVENQKMSKSLGNYVSPDEIIDNYGTDAFRYFFLRHIPSYNDGDYSKQAFEDSYNNELANELGNALQRTIAMIDNYQAGKIGALPEIQFDDSKYLNALEICHFDHALDEVWQLVRGLNQYIEENKPWMIAKTEDKDRLRTNESGFSSIEIGIVVAVIVLVLGIGLFAFHTSTKKSVAVNSSTTTKPSTDVSATSTTSNKTIAQSSTTSSSSTTASSSAGTSNSDLQSQLNSLSSLNSSASQSITDSNNALSDQSTFTSY